MTWRTLFSALQRLLVVLVLLASGGYLLVYLYRWEWNRAVISGLVFVAAEIVLATSAIVRRIGSSGPPPASFELALARLRQADVERRRPFRWLSETDGFGVFIPVLLGAGVVLSAIAYVVERLAEVTAHATVDRGLARRLSRLAPARPAAAPVAVLQWTRSPRRVGPLAGLVAAAVIIGLSVQVLAELTQSRPDDADLPVETRIELVVEQRRPAPAIDAAAALWVACRPVLPVRNRPVASLRADGDLVVVALRPGIRDLATRRLTGCLADALLSSVQGRVVGVHHTRQG